MVTEYASIIKKIPSPFYKALAQAWIRKEFPRHLFVEVTERCNKRCSFCPRPEGNRDMDFGLFKRIVDEAKIYGACSFSLHLFGEPLLYRNILEAVSYVKRAHRGNVLLLTTNGSLLEEFALDLLGRGVDKIQWSYDKDAYISAETEELLKKSGKLKVRFLGKDSSERWQGERRQFHNYGGTKEALSRSTGTRYPCYHLWLAPAITAEGLMTICCADPLKKAVIGDIRKETISKLWMGMEQIRKEHLAGSYKGICTNCDVWSEYPDIWFQWQKR